MEKIIDGRLYDTNTATEIGSWDNGEQRWSFRYILKTLYKTDNGQYFLYVWGGAATEYAERCDGGYGEGSVIKLISEDEAREFAEKKLTADEYLAEFGLEGKYEGGSRIFENYDGMTVGRLKLILTSYPNDMSVFVACNGMCNYDFKDHIPMLRTDTFAIEEDGCLFITDENSVVQDGISHL